MEKRNVILGANAEVGQHTHVRVANKTHPTTRAQWKENFHLSFLSGVFLIHA